MNADAERARRLVLAALTPAEREGGVAYLTVEPLTQEGSRAIPRRPFALDGPAHVGFVDPEPRANWGHDCRYLVVDAHADRVSSFAGRLPPFGQGGAQWRVVYRAASAPDPQP